MNHPIHRTFENHNIRLLLIDGKPWFVAADTCDALAIINTARALSRLDDDEKGIHSMNTPGGPQNLGIINESGLFSLILTSRKPEAKRFKKWVTSEVLPSLRKHGSYSITGTTYVQPPAPMADHIEADRIVSAGRVFNAMFRTGRSIGMNRRMAASRANQATHRSTGVDLVAELGASDWIDSADTPTPNRRQYQLQQQLRTHLAENDWPLMVTGPSLIEALGLTEDRANQMAVGQCLPLLGYRRVRLPASTPNGIRPWGYALQQNVAFEELSA
ncbi:BRO-N domain-containing protein [Pseudomonas sp. C5pp]|uniref:BRO-N domain-containing protein n=1 Tax=Pseudomonas sp. C5pp TaxID=1586081 RepID=UPI00057D68D0|nr:Bro-N domain-containing protein [Pseudomonas sp. C5pp]EKT4540170.1 Bro-N domain-containing protein [Pseudomonas putida]KIC82629.1 BRO domain protein [Pseudomonas sp. C5pp]